MRKTLVQAFLVAFCAMLEGGCMNTRKQFLRDGFGLAAILSSQTAPAILVRSMAAARNGIVLGRKRLPYDAEVEYLENPGLTQYIDTGIVGGEGLRVQTNILPIEQINDKWAIGSYDANARIYVVYQYKSGSSGGYWSGGYGTYFQGTNDTAMSFDTFQNLDVEFTSTEQILKIDGVEKARWAKSGFTGTVASPLWLFGRSGTSSLNSFRCRIGATKIWMNGALVRDFIPVRVGTVGYMYDRVSGRLFGNQGTGDFVLGQDVVPVEYLQSTGTQYIDTGYAVTTDVVKISARYSFTVSESSSTVWGSQTSSDKNWLANQWGDKWWFGTTTGQFGGSQGTNVREVEWNISNGSVSGTVGGTSYNGTYSGSVVSNSSVYLFAVHNGTSASRLSRCRLYRFALYDNGVLVRDFIPVRVGTEGAMKDALTRRFYRNAGTGNFSYGSDKAA